jgi:uncharacterized protein YndB with AHSA1/START domain
MTSQTQSQAIVREIHINAPPVTVFPYFTDPAKMTRWLCIEATLDPRPGGVCHQTHLDGDTRYEMRGEVSPPSKVVFTWGFANPNANVAPGSSTVEVTLTPKDGGTDLRLVHRDLPASEIASHTGGWTTLLANLAQTAAP